MTPLYGRGRQAEPLAAYRDARARLIEEIGIEPGKELQMLERRILRQDESLDMTMPQPNPVGAETTAERRTTVRAGSGLTAVVPAGELRSFVDASGNQRNSRTPTQGTRRRLALGAF